MRFLIEEDWKHDSKGKDKMNRDDVFDALYELVDIWAPDINKFEYFYLKIKRKNF